MLLLLVLLGLLTPASACEMPTVRFDPAGWATDFCKTAVPLTDIKSGGPPRDGIPPIDTPIFEPVEVAEIWLDDAEPVVVLQVGEAVRVYPLQVLIWHEIVNDEVAGVPVSVTFCPLCYAAIAFDRRVGGTTLDFGTTGNLRKSDMVMWDRQTESWWQQFTGEAILGSMTGNTLTQLPAQILGWSEAKKLTGARVLSKRTGHKRPYGANPYAGYDNVAARPWAFEGRTPDDLPPMEHVVGVDLDGAQRAWRRSSLKSKRVIQERLGATDVVLWWRRGGSSALEDRAIADGRDLGAVGVFDARVDGQVLTFEAVAGGFRDQQTKSLWNGVGEATSGLLEGKRLRALPHHNVFWFAWAAFAVEGTLAGE